MKSNTNLGQTDLILLYNDVMLITTLSINNGKCRRIIVIEKPITSLFKEYHTKNVFLGLTDIANRWISSYLCKKIQIV